MPEFSVIIPAYNAEKTIENCIYSILNQTITDWEIILINDGSSDATKALVEKMIPDQIVINKENGGVSAARNLGITKARGEYILFLDADDFLPNNALYLYKQAIIDFCQPDIIFGSFKKIYPKREKICNPINLNTVAIFDKDQHDFNPYIPRLMGTVWGKCYKSKFIKSAKFDMSLSMCEDADFNYRIILNANKLVYINQIVYNYTYSNESTIHRFDEDNLNKYILSVNKIEKINRDTIIYQSAIEFICTVLNLICFNLIFSKNNKNTLNHKADVLKRLMNEPGFKNSLEKVNLDQLPLKHRIAIHFSKNKRVGGLLLLSMINRLNDLILYR